jgi:uncharacterized protein YkwD
VPQRATRSLTHGPAFVLLVGTGLALAILLYAAAYERVPADAQEVKGQKEANGPTTSCPVNFADVGSSDYFYDAVGHMYCSGVIGGYGDSTFRPYNPTTRGQFSKMVVLAEAFPINTSGGPHFGDVPVGSAFYDYVETAYNRHIISGYADGTFRPNAGIGRGQLAKMLVIAEGWPLDNPSTARFNDVPVGSTYYKYVETAVSRKVISGYGDGTFRLGVSATRGQISKVLFLAAYGTHLTALEQQTIDLINQRRAAMSLGSLTADPSLTLASRQHSVDIGPAGLCQHDGTDGTSPWDRIAREGYTGAAMGEVVGCGFSTPQGVVDGWWGSPGHLAILTDAGANSIGCGWWVSSTGAGWQTCDTGHMDR